MSELRFSDGMTFDTAGPLRVVEKSDGLYVVGGGMLLPVRDRAEARDVLDRFHADPFNPSSLASPEGGKS